MAVCLPVLVLVLMACLAGIACLTAQLRCTDAAREAARLLARGDTAGANRAVAQLVPGARAEISRRDDLVSVRITAHPVGLLPGIEIVGEATSAAEPE